jgi:outer membrane protein OmpA-like peptidoglycan-associated protein
MSVNLLEMLSQAASPGLVKSLAGHLGESDSAVGNGLSALLPALLGGLASKASSGAGASSVFSALTDPKIDSGLLGNLGSLLGSGQSSSITSVGTTLMSGLFGADKLSGLGSALAGIAGLRPGNAGGLVALAAPMVFGAIKKLIAERGLNAAGTAAMLVGQKSFLAHKLEPSLTAALGLGSPASLLSGLTPVTGAATGAVVGAVGSGGAAAASGIGRWLPWAVGMALGVGLLWTLFGGSKVAAPTVAAPAPAVVAPAAAPAPATVAVPAVVAPAFDLKAAAKVFFESGKSDISTEGASVISAVASLMAAEPGKKVDLTGYTDKTGNTEANQALAKSRAKAVQAALVAKGVNAERITGRPPVFVEVGAGGADAQARRVEITTQ